METINKLLVVLTRLAIFASVAVTFRFLGTIEAIANNIAEKLLEASKNKSIIANAMTNDQNITTTTTHPYNECIKLFADQAKEDVKGFDFNNVKSMCFELLNKDKSK